MVVRLPFVGCDITIFEYDLILSLDRSLVHLSKVILVSKGRSVTSLEWVLVEQFVPCELCYQVGLKLDGNLIMYFFCFRPMK